MIQTTNDSVSLFVGLSPASETGTTKSGNAKPASALSRMWQGMIASQEARAQRIVYPHLARQDDNTLRELGFSDLEIDAIRNSPDRLPRYGY